MKPHEFEAWIANGRELRNVEFKSPGNRKDKNLFGKVVRAMMAMANTQDGGFVIVGVEETKTLNPVGVSPIFLKTWTHDDVADAAATYTDPAIEFQLEHLEWDSKWFVVISVSEFHDTPILCTRDLGTTLRHGACYVRPRKSKPESVEVPSHADFRDIIELAVVKGVRRFIGLVGKAGIATTGDAGVKPDDSALFDAELDGLV